MDPGTTNAKNACWVQNWVHKIEHKTFKISIQKLLRWLNMFLKPFCIVLQVPCNNKYHQMDICMICQNDFLLWIPPFCNVYMSEWTLKTEKSAIEIKVALVFSDPAIFFFNEVCTWYDIDWGPNVSKFFFVRALCGTFQKAIKNCTIRCPILGRM